MIPKELMNVKPLSGKDRLGMMRDSEYLGAEDIDPGTEPIVTIDAIYNATVTLQRGKENKDVITFKEESVPGIRVVRPLIVNATNRKTLRKIYKSVSVDALVGKKIQLFVDHNVRDPQTGEKTDGIRVKPKVPTAPRTEPIICEQCGKEITASGKWSADDVAKMAVARFGKKLCVNCGKEAGAAQAMAESNKEASPAQTVADNNKETNNQEEVENA